MAESQELTNQLMEAKQDAEILDTVIAVRDSQLKRSTETLGELTAASKQQLKRFVSTKEQLPSTQEQLISTQEQLEEQLEEAEIADEIADATISIMSTKTKQLSDSLSNTQKENAANKKQLDGANKKLLQIYKGRVELSNARKEQMSQAMGEVRKERAVMIAELSQGRAANAEQLSQMESSCRAERAAKLEMLANMEHELKTIRPGQTHLTKDQENLFGQMVSVKKAAAPNGPIKAPNVKPGATMAHGPEVTLMQLTSKYKNSAELKSNRQKRQRAKLGQNLQGAVSAHPEDSADVKKLCIVEHITEMVERNKETYREACTRAIKARSADEVLRKMMATQRPVHGTMIIKN